MHVVSTLSKLAALLTLLEKNVLCFERKGQSQWYLKVLKFLAVML